MSCADLSTREDTTDFLWHSFLLARDSQVPNSPWVFSAISVPSPALNQAYQRWLSSPELSVPTHIRCKEQPSLPSFAVHSLTWTHRFSWPNARVWSEYSKAKEIKKGLLVQRRGKWQVLLLWALLYPIMIILAWGISTTLGHSWCKYPSLALPAIAQIIWKKWNYSKTQPTCRQMQIYWYFSLKYLWTKLYYCTVMYFTCSGIKFFYHFSTSSTISK